MMTTKANQENMLDTAARPNRTETREVGQVAGNDTLENALILISDIRAALARGTRHYNRAGELMATEQSIVETLLNEGGITFEPQR